MTALDALRWATEAGACDASEAPTLPDAAADLLRRLDFPVVGASPAVPATGTDSREAA